MKTDPELQEGFPKLAERITTELRGYPERIIAQFLLKLREIPISRKNTVFFFPKTTKFVDFFVLKSNYTVLLQG